MFTLYQLGLALLLCWLALPVLAQQQLAKVRRSSYLTKVFRLTETQARRLYERGLLAARPDFFTVPVDSFPTDSVGRRRWRMSSLPLGYYLVAHTEGPQLVYSLRAETSRTLEVINNQYDLSLTVRDSLGELVRGARVAVGGRALPYDPATGTYRRARNARPGLAAVTVGGRTTFHPLELAEDYPSQPRGSWALRAGRRVLYGRPLGYLTVPMWRTVRDLKHPAGVSTGLVGLVRAPFSESVREQRHDRRAQARRQQWLSYLVLSQPRYRPAHDTLRLKARVLRRGSGRPATRPLVLWLSSGGQRKRLATLRPVRPGSYEYSLPLTDTLGLRPDTEPELALEDEHGYPVASGSFAFEDYELKNNHYALRLLAKEPWRGQPQAVLLRGSDANELNLPDARVRLAVLPAAQPGELPTRRLFLPDTLWTTAQALDPVGETRVNLPPSIFPDLDLAYTVQATFLTSDNERHVESLTFPYRRDAGRLHAELVADSVRLRFDSAGVSRPHRARLTWTLADYVQGDSAAHRRMVQLPLALPLNYLADSYELRDAAGRRELLSIDEDNAALSLRSERTDSLRLVVENPHGVTFWYYVFQGSTLRYRGYATRYRLAVPASSADTWHVSLHYDWGGERRAAEFTAGPAPRQLYVATEQPDVAYPGQRLPLAFTVTDEAGRPVAGADLTAYAYTSKFAKSEAPTLPAAARPVVGRPVRARFQLDEDFDDGPARHLLDWQRWRPQLGLDSLRFYDFLYPAGGAFYEYQPAPGGLTQVAPFVVDSGRVQAPIAVYVDGEPVYIHDVNQGQPYAAVADSGLHTLSVRTSRYLVTLRGVYLRPLHKLTFSLDLNQPCAELTVEPRPAALLPDELLTLRRTLLAVSGHPGAVLRQGPVLRPLPYAYGNSLALAGPFRPDSMLLRGQYQRERRKFLFEPLYDYRFEPGLQKMTCLDPARLGLLNGAGLPYPLPLGDFAAIETDFYPAPRPATPTVLAPPAKSLRPRAGRGTPRPAPTRPLAAPPAFRPPVYRAQPIWQRAYPVLRNPSQTLAGQGRLELRAPRGLGYYERQQLLYVLLTRPDQPKFRRLQPGLAVLHALPPGSYRMAVLRADSTCLVPRQLVQVPADGQTYFQLSDADQQPAGATSRYINQLLWRLTPHVALDEKAAQPERREIKVQQPGPPQPGWRLLRGRVLDRASEAGLPGVTVLVKGTTVGTSTAADGSYALRVPPGPAALTFSFVGYVTQELPLDYRPSFDVSLVADTRQLSEVVVVGYGTQRRSDLTGSVSSVLQGRVAGVSMGAASAVVIRGSSTVAAATEPLYIVNGLPFSGKLADIVPADILTMKVLKGSEAMAVYGARASGGVVLLTLRGGALVAGQPVGPAPDPAGAAGGTAGLRRRFRDYAWWQPILTTDAQGRAHTTVTLPDDITSWDTFVLGSDAHGRFGGSVGRLRSFKALLATLATPRFLVAGDRVQVLGKTLNYQPDTAQVTTSFRVAGQAVRRQARRVGSATIDTLTVAAPVAADSLQLSFNLEQASGYADGEQRSLPVLPLGSRERVGSFAVLTAADTILALPLDARLGEVQVRVESDALPALLSEIQHLQAYAYLCNEQAASRLLALLLEQRIRAQQGAEFKGQKVVNFLIKKLLAGRHQPEGIWGTWPNSTISPWATVHVVEALLAAEKAGYPVAFDRPQLTAYLLRELDASLSLPTAAAPYYTGYFNSGDDQIRLLKLLHTLGAPAPYGTYLRRVEAAAPQRPPLDRYLALTELRQQLGLSYQLDSLRRYRLRTELGGVCYGDTLHQSSYYHYLLANKLGTTLLAYRLLRAQGGHAAELVRIRTYLLGLRAGGYWGSTYATAQILATIGPDLLVPGTGAPVRVQLSGLPGLPAGPVTKFPLALTLPAGAGPLTVRKEGELPVYATAYQTRWNPTPAAAAAPFVVTTTLAGQAGTRVALPAGRPAELLITVEAQAEARYVVLEVPIPAGCSYGDPAAPNSLEVHREYLKHQAGIFIDRLPIGKHTFRISLQPRYRGQYTLNPARAELLYFPTKFGRTASKQVLIK